MFDFGFVESGFTGDAVEKRVLANVFGLHVLPFPGFDKSSIGPDSSTIAVPRSTKM